ncbi:MAG: AtpZ/AtpI family protein [Flavobacteriales bacterium]|nr:AtpZ/AtpI family protein [Flavobacteriales bacterium]MDW8431333.1 AtpZ/AtpI family protein [Flavobacteriales bacterium]
MKKSDIFRYADLGLRLVVLCLGLVGGGVWADNLWHTQPWLTLFGALMAVVSVLWLLLRINKNSASHD